jgi:hypothetical protein
MTLITEHPANVQKDFSALQKQETSSKGLLLLTGCIRTALFPIFTCFMLNLIFPLYSMYIFYYSLCRNHTLTSLCKFPLPLAFGLFIIPVSPCC